MRTLKVSSFIPAPPAPVYEFVTAYPVEGDADRAKMESKYGQLLEQDGTTFKFLENVGGGITWECVFDPPTQRTMRAVDSTWSDRTDQFEAVDGGTLWTITWQLKAKGLAIFTQWLTFNLRARRQVHHGIVSPVVAHFRGCVKRPSAVRGEPVEP